MKLQHRITRARQDKGFTQEELATLTKLSIRTIQRIESGESIPRSFTLKAIAKALDQPYELLIADESVDPAPQASSPAADVRHFLQLFNLSCFSFILLPWVHFLVP
jgi:transcriptional regulator with XRE-family HTH domain